MSRLSTSFVLGYHGCDTVIAPKAILEGQDLLHSNRDYDWLGPGAYFWEADPRRAWEWALWKASWREIKDSAVVGAVIDLRNCLDLTTRHDVELTKAAYLSFVKIQSESKLEVPENISPTGTFKPGRVLRFLDCAVMRHLHWLVERGGFGAGTAEPFDTVRALFVEGGPAYPGAGFNERNHVQIAVRSRAAIKGLFLVDPAMVD